jgi:hypothetical protein
MRVLIISEDFRHDRYILEPIIHSMLSALGKPRAKVEILTDPLLGSVDQALKWERIEGILELYKGMFQLFLLCVDRDGQEGRKASLQHIEGRAVALLKDDQQLLGENAWQEIEVWLLAGHDLPAKWVWKKVRKEVHPKEVYYLPFARQHGLSTEPSQGRKILGREAASRYSRIRQRCPEVTDLEERIRQWLESKK